MPKRPRQHELETESERAFANAMPSFLVARDMSDDYGIDKEVEVFEGGQTTGFTFKVQLKATDKSGAKVRVRRDSLGYWNSLDVPVLLVTYEAPTETLRARWVHSIGLEGPDRGGDDITVRMDPDLHLDDAWAANLTTDLSVLRDLRRGVVPNPLPVRLAIANNVDLNTTAVTAAVIQLSRSGAHPMRKARQDEAALLLEVTKRRYRALLPQNAASASYRLAAEQESGDTRDCAAHLLLLTATALIPVNPRAAAALAVTVPPTATLWLSAEVAERLAPVLATDAGADLLIEVCANLETVLLAAACAGEDPGAETEDAHLLYYLALAENISHVSEDSFRGYSEEVLEGVENPLVGDEAWSQGRRLYNLAHLHLGRNDPHTAVELLRQAVTLETRYEKDPDYHRHLGRATWETGEFSDAAAAYQRALDFGFDAYEVRPLLADSLMYAGRYQAARDALVDWEPQGLANDRPGTLRLVMLDEVLTVTGLTEQSRATFAAADLLASFGDEPLHDPDVQSQIVNLLRTKDALHPALWAARIDGDDLQAGMAAALIAAMMVERAAELWVTALLCALAAGADKHLTGAILQQARFLCGDEFYDAAMDAAEEQTPENANLLRTAVSEVYADEPTRFGTALRLVAPPDSGDWVIDKITIGDLLATATGTADADPAAGET